MQTVEFAILDWFQTLHGSFLDVLLPAISRLSDHGEVWILLAVILLIMPKTRKVGIALACGLAFDFLLCNLWLKPMIGRIRPYELRPAVELLVSPPQDAAFPSGHTAVSFAAVAALATAHCRLWKPALVLAVLIALSRLYLYVHWPTDVLGGVIVGTFAGWIGAKAVEWMTKRINRKEL